MKKALVVVLAMVLFAGVSFGAGVGYQNFVLGMPKAQVIQKARELYLSNFRRDADNDYQVLHDLICEIGRMDFGFDDNDRLAKITIHLHKENADLTVEAIHKKWGKPTSHHTQIYQNQFGAKTEGWTETWVVGEDIVMLLKIPRTLKEIVYAYILMTHAQMLKEGQKKPLPKL